MTTRKHSAISGEDTRSLEPAPKRSKTKRSKDNFPKMLPFCNRETASLQVWKNFRENFLNPPYGPDGEPNDYKGNATILCQMFGSGKSQFARRVFNEVMVIFLLG